MAKVTARVSVKGMDMKDMMAAAKEQMADLGSDIKWKITEMDLYSQDDMATKEGMAKMWHCSMTMEADIKD